MDVAQILHPQGLVAPVLVNYVVGTETGFVILWNLPPNYYWTEVLSFVRSLFPRKHCPIFVSILCTVINGQQIFWFKGDSCKAIDRLHAVLACQNAVGSPWFEVDYVSEWVWSTASANYMDSWNLEVRMTLEQPGARPSLLDRLNVPPGRANGPYPSVHFFLEDPPPPENPNP